jgi:serine/threonine protein kinase
MNKLREMPDPSFVNFIGRCLEWDPKKRLTPDEGLQHEWIIKGLPKNIILHNPHNNPYARNDQNSSENALPNQHPKISNGPTNSNS